MGNISLIGFMGSGKTTVSKILSENLRMDFVDLDDYIEKTEKMDIRQIFASKGEEYFRNCESDALKSHVFKENIILSCGGGVILKQENICLLRDNSTVFFLCATGETVFRRIKNMQNRPLLSKNMNIDFIEKMIKSREEKYLSCAHYTVFTDETTPENVAKEIEKIIFSKKKG